MRVLLNWVKEFVGLEAGDDEIARRLTLSGLEVEEQDRLDRGLDNVVVGEVRERTPIEGTKLSVCRVFDGTEELQIVCGAQNYGAGDHVPLARIGASLPNGMEIGRAKLRGIESFGMLCSPTELGLADSVDGLLSLPRDTVPGTPIAQVIGRVGTALTLNVTPNRADALSHFGVARELAALFGAPLNAPAAPEGLPQGECAAGIEIEAPDLCHRFTARVIEGVKVGPSPEWLSRRLEAIGQRSVNNVVDATNYVLFELGQPTHAYDLDRVAGGKLVARRARDGEMLRTLDGKDRNLTADDLVIADAERAVGLAGVMGGEDSEVSEGTTRLLLESAFFLPTSVRRSARRHGIHSEASHRFERGVDPEGTLRALERLTQLILQVAGGRAVGGAADVHPTPYARPQIRLRRARMDAMLGMPTPWDEARAVLVRLGLRELEATEDAAAFEAPGARLDLSTEIDLVEEVARVRGFEHIPTRLPGGAGTEPAEEPVTAAEGRARTALAAAGFDEAVNFTFVGAEELARVAPEPAPIRLLNPLAMDQAVMRTTLLPGLLRNLAHNLRHGTQTVRLYELGRAFLPLTEAPTEQLGEAGFRVDREPWRLALVATGPRMSGWTGGKDAVDFYDLKGAVEQVLEALGLGEAASFALDASAGHLHPRSAAVMRLGGAVAGRLGELHPALADALELPRGVFVAELEMDALVGAARLTPRFQETARFPASLRDVAVVVDDRVTAADVLDAIRAEDEPGLVEHAELFDVYKGAPLPEGKKNLAFGLRYRAQDRTLKDEEVNGLHARIVDALQRRFGAELRA